MNNFAPVVIPTLNRHMHLKQCVESLSSCTHADKTDLFIFLDYPLKDGHKAGYELIKTYLPNIKGFKTVNVIMRENNFGPVANFSKSIEYVFERYDRLIFSEDDNEFSPNFLDYINKGLDKFENNNNVFAVCGYNFPAESPPKYKYNYFFYQRFSAWGTGIWKNKFPVEPVWDYNKIAEFTNNKNYANILKRQAERHYYRLLYCIKNKITIYGDEVLILICIIRNQYCVYPVESKVRNNGHDGTGVHGSLIVNNLYSKQKIDDSTEFEYNGEAPLVDKDFDRFYRSSLKISKMALIKGLILKPIAGSYLEKVLKRLIKGVKC